MIVAAVDWTEWTAIGTLAAAVASVCLGCVTVLLVMTTKGIVSGNKDERAATNRLAEAAGNQARDAALALALQVEPRIVPVHESIPRFVVSDNIGGSVGVHWVNPLLLEVENVGTNSVLPATATGIRVVEALDGKATLKRLGADRAALSLCRDLLELGALRST